MTSEVPSSAAKHGVFPKVFGKLNKHESPVFALTATSIIMQITLLFSAFEKNAFLAIISISGSMILIPYVLSAFFLSKLALSKKKMDVDSGKFKAKALFTGITASVYGLWLVYAAGIKYILLSTILYSIGIIVYRIAWKEKDDGGPMFKPVEKVIILILVILAAASVIMLVSGIMPVDNWIHWFQHYVIEIK